MAISTDDVRYIAALARLRFTEDEQRRLAAQLSQMLDYVDTLNALDTTGVPPMAHVLDLHNVFRDDAPQQRLGRDDALRNAPDADSTYFRVPKVIE